jgi:hypothetical protein
VILGRLNAAAELYDPHRFKLTAIGRLVKENVNAPATAG